MLRTYASQLQTGWKTLVEREDKAVLLYEPQDYFDAVKDAIADGYDVVKIDPCFAGLTPEMDMMTFLALQSLNMSEEVLRQERAKIVTAVKRTNGQLQMEQKLRELEGEAWQG